MGNWLYNKCYGKYRLLLPIDKTTNDFPREDNMISEIDMYIPCKYGEISYYGHGKLNIYLTSKIVKKRLFKDMEEKNIGFSNLVEGDDEFSFVVNGKYIDYFAEVMKAKTSGKKIRPTSVKNLPTSDYVISQEKLKEYKEITGDIGLSEGLKIKDITDDFILKTLAKKHGIKDVKKDMKFKCMFKQKKEYIDSYNMWDEYITYLNKKLKNLT